MPDRFDQVRALYLEALEVRQQERLDWLDRSTADEQVVAQVKALLQQAERETDPLEAGLRMHQQTDLPEIPEYRVVRELGRGGQGVVYEAIQLSTNQRVAIKMLRLGRYSTGKDQDRFEREIAVLAKLNHPHILTVLDRGETSDGGTYLVTELVDGLPIDVAGNRLDPSEMLGLFSRVAKAVHAAHHEGVVHRDLKPSNILVDRHGEPRILDFGLSAVEPTVDLAPKTITLAGQPMGSPQWVSPEQAAGKPVDARTDVYSLGVILYQLASGGQFPYEVRGHAPELLQEAHRQPIRTDGIDAKLAKVVRKALEKNPRDRFQTAEELAAEVDAYQASVPPTQQSNGRIKYVWPLLAVVGIIGGIYLINASLPDNKELPGDKELTGNTDLPVNTEVPKAPNETTTPWQAVDWSSVAINSGGRLSGEASQRNVQGRFDLPKISGKAFAVRGSFKRISGGELDIYVQSASDRRVVLSLPKSGPARLSLAGKWTHAESGTAAIGGSFIFVIRERQCSVAIDDQWVMQLRFPNESSWQFGFDTRGGEIDIEDLEWCSRDLPDEPTIDATQKAVVDLAYAADGVICAEANGRSDESFSVTSIEALQNGVVSPRSALSIAECRRLRQLWVSGVKPNALALLSELPNLERLAIWSSKLDDTDIEAIGSMSRLQGIDMQYTEVADFDANHFAGLQRLSHLGIYEVELTDNQIQQLTAIRSLETVIARGNQVTAQGIAHLRSLKRLTRLELRGNQLSGQIEAAFSSLPQLTWLGLEDGNLTDDDVEPLAKLTHLRWLSVKGTLISPAGLDQLRNALTDCQVEPTATP